MWVHLLVSILLSLEGTQGIQGGSFAQQVIEISAAAGEAQFYMPHPLQSGGISLGSPQAAGRRKPQLRQGATVHYGCEDHDGAQQTIRPDIIHLGGSSITCEISPMYYPG